MLFTQSNLSKQYQLATLLQVISLSLYVDDIIIIGDDIDDISVLKTKLVRQFEMKDLSYLQYFIGIEVTRSIRDYLISQSKILQIFLSGLDLLTIRL